MTARPRILVLAVLFPALSVSLLLGAWICQRQEVQRNRQYVSATHPSASGPASRPAASRPDTRPAEWAQPLWRPGIGNFCRVSDGLYRGEQPSEEGMRELKKMGIKTIVNLRALHSDRDKMKDNQFKYVNINMKPWHAEDEDVVEFLKVVADKDNAPVFVHCQHGSDRTGMLCAIYRIAVQGWSREGAIEEMVQGGYGFHEDWTNLVAYLRHVDVEKLKKGAGMAP